MRGETQRVRGRLDVPALSASSLNSHSEHQIPRLNPIIFTISSTKLNTSKRKWTNNEQESQPISLLDQSPGSMMKCAAIQISVHAISIGTTCEACPCKTSRRALFFGLSLLLQDGKEKYAWYSKGVFLRSGHRKEKETDIFRISNWRFFLTLVAPPRYLHVLSWISDHKSIDKTE